MLSTTCRALHCLSRYAFSIAVLALLCAASAVQARDAFVVISGGGGPEGNNYSQYLQARAYVQYLRDRYAHEDIWLFFGAGNITGQPAIVADVIQTVKNDKGEKRNTWIPGALPGNRPARFDAISRAFREEILPAVRDGGTLYLLVGDHGASSGGGHGGDSASPEGTITLWSFGRDSTHPRGWRTYDESLGVAQLREWLSAGLGRGRVVFSMSQCYSGGFHHLGIARQVAPNPEWFTSMPVWAAGLRETNDLPIAAGMTSTDERSLASGCTPDVDADRWQGYERHLPESLVGLDLFTLEPSGKERRSLYEAHVEAVLADRTIDKPRTTSEHYLQSWARVIAQVAKESQVHSSIEPQLAKFKQVMNGTAPQAKDPAFVERKAEFQRMIERMVRDNPALKDLPTASQEELERLMQPAAHEHKQGQEKADRLVDRRVADELWNKHIEPAWRAAIQAGQVTGLSAPIVAFERDVLKIDELAPVGGRSASAHAHSHGGGAGMATYWHGGFGNPQSFDPSRAQMISDWAKERRRKILEWARKSQDSKVSASAGVYEASVPASALDGSGGHDHEEEEKGGRPSRGSAAARIHLYRQVLAAWQFLLDVEQRPALARVKALTELERTPFPAGAQLPAGS